MSHDITSQPDQWANGVVRVPGSPDPGVFVLIREPIEGRPPGSAVIVWHWHTPTQTNAGSTDPRLIPEPRWEAAGCDRHTVVNLDPLHLEPSLACENGCANHGWIRDGIWTSA